MSTDRHLSSEELDLLELGSLSAQEQREAEAHLAACAPCAAQRRTLGEDVAHFRQYVAPRGNPVDAVPPGPRSGWLRWVALGLTAGVAVLALVLLRPVGPDAQDGYVAVRGEPQLAVIVARGGSQSQLTEEQVLKAGDRLRFQVDGAGARFVQVLSLDGAGTWSAYAPFGGEISLPLGSGSQTLPGAVELDDTAGVEWLVAVFSQRPLQVTEVLASLRASGWAGGDAPPRLPGASAVQVIRFQKR